MRGANDDGEIKHGALAGLALDGHGAAVEFDEALADGEAEPRAAVATGGGGVDLREFFEESVEPVGRNANAGIANAKGDLVATIEERVAGDVNGDFTVIGELDGVGEEVDEDLPEAGDVADDSVGRARGKLGEERDFFLGGTRGEETDGGGHTLEERERRELYLEFARLDFGEIENVVNDAQEMIAAGLDGLDTVALFGRKRGVAEEGGHADDGIHGCANLVTHGREKLGLGAGGFLGDAAGLLEGTAGRLKIRDDAVLIFDEAAELEGVDDVTAERAQRLQLLGRQYARLMVDHTERAEGPAIVGDQRRAGVEADVGITEDGGIVGEPRVEASVGHDEHIARGLVDGVSAERSLSGGFGASEPDLGFEPLTIGIDERDERDGDLTDLGGEAREFVVIGFGRGIENAEGTEVGNALGVVGRNGGTQHAIKKVAWCEFGRM